MKKEYIIEIYRCNGTAYICGGTYKIGQARYAKCTTRRTEAKRFKSEALAQKYGERLSRKCENLQGVFFIQPY